MLSMVPGPARRVHDVPGEDPVQGTAERRAAELDRGDEARRPCGRDTGGGSLGGIGCDGSGKRVVDHPDLVEVEGTVMNTQRQRPTPDPQVKSTARWLYLVAVTGCAIFAPVLLLREDTGAGTGLLALLFLSLGGLVASSEDR